MRSPLNMLFFFITFLLFQSCSSKITENYILKFNQDSNIKFNYFANGHLGNGVYPFKIVEKDGRYAGEVVRASDAAVYSGLYSFLPSPIYSSDGKSFAMDVWMDHLGSFTLKLEESTDGGPTTSI